MSGSWEPTVLPNLDSGNHQITSPSTDRYNCIAWAAGSNAKFWWPEKYCYWPEDAPREVTLDAFLSAFGTLGYVKCEDGDLEDGYEKIAIYAIHENSILVPTHAAKQMQDGKWTSKLGRLEDIVHVNPQDVECPSYGEASVFMKRGL